jgi:DegV family protein with EDD domain
MGHVAVVTDSTVDLAPADTDALGLRVVPMTVTFGDESYISRITITDERFYQRLRDSPALPTTSQPVPAWFEEAYADAADDDADAVVSIHVSGGLSGTVETARKVAADAPLPVEVIDSRQVSGGLALAVLAAAEAAAAGADLAETARVAADVAARARFFFTVDTLDYLRRGGRLSGAQAVVGNVLRVKPILTIRDGEVEVLERTRTWSRATDRLVELCHTEVGDAEADVVLVHGLAAERASAVGVALDDRLSVARRVDAVIGPVVGTHCGPGAIGVAVVPH